MVTETGEGGKEANNRPMTSTEELNPVVYPKVSSDLEGGIEMTMDAGLGKESSKDPIASKEEDPKVPSISVQRIEEVKENLNLKQERKSMNSSDQESPRGVLEIPVSGVESDGGSGSESSPLATVAESHSLHWRSLIGGLLRKKRSLRRMSSVSAKVVAVPRIECDEGLAVGGGSQPDVVRGRPRWRSFSCKELVAATDNFSTEENKESLKVEPAKKSMDNSYQESPRGVLEIPILDVDSDGGGSSSESSTLDNPIVVESHNLQWRSLIGGLFLRKKRSMLRLSTFPQATPVGASLRRSLVMIQCEGAQMGDGGPQTELPRGSPTWRSFDCRELAAATGNFSPDKLIGKGGHAEVYKGCLPDGQLVAVKKLTKGDNEEKVRDFLSELGIIAHVNHPNAAQLLGFSVEGGLHLVLKFSPHGSLSSVLHGSKEGLNWENRFKIALGIAQGLLYLHEGCQRRIIHRDIKASNILLTDDYQPQISDFGLAKWLPDKWSHHIVFPIEGTFGYLAPEYFMHGIVNEKTDVFAYGVLLLELITGRRAVDSSRQSLAIWAKPLLESGNTKELIDPVLRDAYDPKETKRAVSAASMCIHHLSTMRPNMNWVVRLLRGEERVSEFVGREPRRRPPLFDAGDSEDYTCSRYLNDLHRHKELAMEQ